VAVRSPSTWVPKQVRHEALVSRRNRSREIAAFLPLVDRLGDEPMMGIACGAATSDWLPTRDLPLWPGRRAQLKGRRYDCSRPTAGVEDQRVKTTEHHLLRNQWEESRYAC